MKKSNSIDFINLPNNRFVRIFNNIYWAWIILGVSLALTAVAYAVAKRFVHERMKEQLEFQVEHVREAIENRSSIYEQVLWGGVGLFNASDGWVERQRFAAYVATLNIDQNWPGIQGIGFSVPIEGENLDEHIAFIQQEGFANYEIYPAHKRDYYTSIIYLEPFDWRNQRAFGYDMWSNELRREAMKRARDKGESATSGVITLVQETEEDIQKGFLTYVPVYKNREIPKTVEERRRQFIGWVYAPFRAGNLMKGILTSETKNIEFEIFDGLDKNPSSLIYDSDRSLHTESSSHSPFFSKSLELELQGRVWTVYFHTQPNYLENNRDAKQPNIVLVAGLLVDLLLFLVIYYLYLSNKRIQIASKDMSNMIKKAPQALMVLNRSGRVINSNAKSEQLFGYAPNEMHLKNFMLLVCKENQDKQDSFFDFVKFLQLEEPTAKNLIGLKKDGTKFEIEMGVSELSLDLGICYMCSIVDTSTHKSIQRSLEDMNQKLGQKNQEMEQFVFTVSHDLKTPLVTIGGFSTQLMKSLGNQLNKKENHKLERIIFNVKHMEDLLADLLSLSKIIRQKIEKDDHFVDDLLDQVYGTLESAIKLSKAKITQKTEGVKVYGNARLLIQCLQNLLVNALQYGDPDRPQHIEISARNQENNVLISVKDNGIGIEEKYHKKIFEIFERLNIGEGTGVGLAIVKTIIDKHQGKINLESTPGEGSTFTLEFPNQKRE